MSNDHLDYLCPLCQASVGQLFYDRIRTYFRCSVCSLVFVSPHQRLSPQAEKTSYDQHENSPDDLRYRDFLNRLCTPMSQRLAPRSYGLDFGSGPGPTLSIMFQELGHSMEIYDPYYAANIERLQQQYDFISASEVVEHLYHPRKDLERVWSCLKLNGLLGIMTQHVVEQDEFPHWRYKDDSTHVCFFATQTFQWLANKWGATLTMPSKDVVLLTKT